MKPSPFACILLITYILGASYAALDNTRADNAAQGNIFAGSLRNFINFKKAMNIPIPDLKEQSSFLARLNPATLVDEILDPQNVKFYFFSKNRPMDAVRVYVNDSDGLESAGYNIFYPTKVITHGFLNDLTSETIQTIKNNFLNISYEELNVIAVDWSYYATFYGDVYGITRAVGELVAEFIDFIVNEGTSLDDVHCIGHSLGAHVCGFAGSGVSKGLIARITGLDPAQYKFHSGSDKRLNSTDAKFVDCIHTNGGQLGLISPICSADFYPNKGRRQPGCLEDDIFSLGGCSHGRSHQYFAESILPGHSFPSVTCDSIDFYKATCTDEGAFMGYPAFHRYSGIFYTETNSEYPFAKNVDDD